MKAKFVLLGLFLCAIVPAYSADVTVNVDASASLRKIPMTLYGGNLTAWDGDEDGTNANFNNLMIASGRKYFRWCGGSWGDCYLWSDMEGPDNSNTWIVSYPETLYLLSQISQPGQDIAPTLQPIVNFPGHWYGYTDDQGNYVYHEHGHQAAVDAAAAWVADQSTRTTTAEFWEIGNETGGPWEEGWFEGISGTYYGDYFADFYNAMKAENSGINIGATAEPRHELQSSGWYEGYWTYDTLVAAAAKGAVPDFLIIHQYPGTSEAASYNPTLLSDRVADIAEFTSNLDDIVEDAVGSSYVGQVRYWMTEWDCGNGENDSYRRTDAYVNAMFRLQYTLEMARCNWQGSNPWAQNEYGSGYTVRPSWYVHPLLIYYFGRVMVEANSSDSPLVRAYAAKSADGSLTVCLVNNSPTSQLTADVNIADFVAGAGGKRWVAEPAGSFVTGGVNIQDYDNIKINGIVRPDPMTISSLAPQSFTSGNNFTVTLPASCIMLLKVPMGTGDLTPPDAPGMLEANLDGINIVLDWNDNTEEDLEGYNVYRSTSPGTGFIRLNAEAIIDSEYTDVTTEDDRTYYYVVSAVDTSMNESDDSNQVSVAVPQTRLGTILREVWTGISGNAVSDLTLNVDYPEFPAVVEYIDILEGPVNWMDGYGTRIRGCLHPRLTGDYTFWIAGDDNCQLWLSTDGTEGNAVMIAEVPGWTNSRVWDKFIQQQSAAISLVGGEKYYIEVLHKEGAGGDNVAVAWSGPSMPRQVIDGMYLSPPLTGLYGDFSGNGTVFVEDLAGFEDLWLVDDCVLTLDADLDGDCKVNLYEFAQLAANWLK